MANFANSHGQNCLLQRSRDVHSSTSTPEPPRQVLACETGVNADKVRLKAHLAFVRQWIAESAHLIAWLKEMQSTTAVTPRTETSEKAVVSALRCIGNSSCSSGHDLQLDSMEQQLSEVKMKLELLKAGWELQKEHANIFSEVSTACDTSSSSASRCTSQSCKSQLVNSIGDSCFEEQEVLFVTADGNVHSCQHQHQLVDYSSAQEPQVRFLTADGNLSF